MRIQNQIAGFLLICLAGALARYMPLSSHQRTATEDNRLAFRDSEGRERLVVGELETGVFGMRIKDRDGSHVRMEFALEQDGDAVLVLRDGSEADVVGARVTPRDSAGLYVIDPSGEFGRAGMELERDKGIRLGLWDATPTPLITLEHEPGNWGMLIGHAGRVAMAVLNRVGRGAGWLLFDEEGQVAAKVIRNTEGGIEVALPGRGADGETK